MFDVAIIGAGVVGSSIARELSKYDIKALVLEKNVEICQGTTKANSAIVHGGYDAKEGTLKARLNVEGNRMYTELAKELDFHFERVGSLVVAFSEEEMEEVRCLFERGTTNKVPGLKILTGDEARSLEPNLSEAVVGALLCESGGVVCPFNMNVAMMENAVENGVELVTRAEVLSIKKENEIFNIETKAGTFQAKYVVNAAGLYSDKVNGMIGGDEFKIIPRKGEYRILDKSEFGIVKRVIFQAPTKAGKGILVAPTVHGNVIVGPTAEEVESPEDSYTTREGIEKVDTLSRKSVPSLDLYKCIRTFTGVRSTPSTGEFMIFESEKTPGFVNVGGIESPGLTAAPAIGVYVVELLEKAGLALAKDENFNPIRKAIREFARMTDEQRAEIIKENPGYKKIICRCETITEAEIIEAIHRPAGARTVDGVKRRVRAGMGRCQGGFCGPRVVEIIARELNMPMEEVLKEYENSEILVGKVKEMRGE